MSKIIPGLYLGNILSSQNNYELESKKIDRVIALLDTPIVHMRRPGMHIYIKDTSDAPIGDILNQTYEYIDKWRESGLRVLVHCYAGVSRSATVVIYYIMKKYKKSYEEALEIVREQRAMVNPNPGFVQVLKLMKF